jgi:hypothetical protein
MACMSLFLQDSCALPRFAGVQEYSPRLLNLINEKTFWNHYSQNKVFNRNVSDEIKPEESIIKSSDADIVVVNSPLSL